MNCANHPDRERQAFCQNCGKPLCRECARTVGHAVFCEPCLEARLAATAAAPPNASPDPVSPGFGAGSAAGPSSYQEVPGAGPQYPYSGTAEGVPYNFAGSKAMPGSPNPAVAVLLGFIPGVGAMYNGQYAKGIVHLIIFAILVSLADSHSIFGLFVAAWVFYQAIEAYHTARARRDGTPLPNPFGLNDVGERFGFGRAWPATPNPVTTPPPSAWSQPVAPASPSTHASTAAGYPPPSVNNPYGTPNPTPRPEAPGTVYGAPSWATPETPQADPYRPVSQPVIPAAPAQSPLPIPIGAIILIGLGILFLLGNTNWLGSLPLYLILPIALIALAVWLFIRRLHSFGAGLTDDGTPGYQLRVVSALQGSVWVLLVGVLFLLDSLHILSWDRSWPLFIIVAGVVVFLRRSATSSLAAQSVAAPFIPQAPLGSATRPSTPAGTRDPEQP